MSENIQAINSVNLSSKTNLITHKQKEYQYGSEPVIENLTKDTVKFQYDTGVKQSKIKKYAYIAAGIVTTALATVGIVFGHKVLKSKKAEKEAQRLAHKARERAQKLAREAQEQARVEAENQAKLKVQAEQEVKVRAKKELQAKKKAQEEAQASAKRKEIEHLNFCAEYHLRSELEKNIPCPYDMSEEIVGRYWGKVVKEESAIDDIEKLAQSIKSDIEKGADITPDKMAEILEKYMQNLGDRQIYSEKIYKANSFLPCGRVADKFCERDTMLKEVIKELRVSVPQKDKTTYDVFKDAINKVNGRYEAVKNARVQKVKDIFAHNEAETAKIRERLIYDENYTPQSQHIELTKEQKKALIDVLNKEAGINLSMDSSMSDIMSAWHWKYIGNPIKITKEAPEGERAILEMFPKYNGTKNIGAGEIYKFNSEFKHAPLYRFIHIENEEEFLRQFDKIGSEYIPDTIQSCGKAKYYGEMYGGLNTRYNFVEWDKHYNIKFVIHPKCNISSAADIGETKYGGLEAIYPAGTRFKFIGKFKKTVTPEEINKAISGGFKFDDFERYEIHLQEL